MSDDINKPHDNVVKNILGREGIAKDFVRYYLPQEISKDLDLETLEVSSQSYVSGHLKESLSDLVIRIQLYNGDLADIYVLIEHKSDMEAWTKLQLLKYMNEIWQATAKENKICLPIVIPLVFYHGKRRWKHSLEFADLFQAPSEYYKKYIPKFEHILHEVPEINEQKVKSTITLEVFHLVLEYIFYPEKRDKIYESFELLFQGLNSKDAEEIFGVLIRYLLSATDERPENAEEKVKHLPKGGETVRTTAERLREEGYNIAMQKNEKLLAEREQRGEMRGVIKGELKNAQETLMDIAADLHGPLPNSLQAKIKSIQSIENLRAITRKVHKTSSLEEFTELVNRAVEN
jgi:predicted transposase/invertase (TIGR01784 family)